MSIRAPLNPRILSRLLKHYAAFRAYVEHEDALVNNRVLWNINIQGFLFATYGISLQKLAQGGHHGPEVFLLQFLIGILPVLGASISYYSWRGVQAAQSSIRNLEDKWNGVLKDEYLLSEDSSMLPWLTGGGAKQAHDKGLEAPLGVPRLFIITWLAILCVEIVFWAIVHAPHSGGTPIRITAPTTRGAVSITPILPITPGGMERRIPSAVERSAGTERPVSRATPGDRSSLQTRPRRPLTPPPPT